MADALDFRQEAMGCIHLAKAETDPELKTILMGMALGWLTFADQPRSPLQDERADEHGVFADAPLSPSTSFGGS
jgi:hypothetical protein